MEETSDSTNNSVLTYHTKHKILTCMCGIVIEGKHSCEVEVSKIQIVECDFVRSRDKNNDCQICIVKENERKFEDQWREDEDGYCYCSFCGDKSYWGLPKQCCCKAYVDNDGLEKCKSCHGTWTEVYLDMGDCDKCSGYHGD